MESLGGLIYGFGIALRPENLTFLMLGVVLGLVVGVLPGLGGTSGVAILLPVTVFMGRTRRSCSWRVSTGARCSAGW